MVQLQPGPGSPGWGAEQVLALGVVKLQPLPLQLLRPVQAPVGEDQRGGAQADRWPGQEDGGQSETGGPPAGGQDQEHRQLEVGAGGRAGQEQERDKSDV